MTKFLSLVAGLVLALSLSPQAPAQVTSQPSPACGTPVVTVPAGSNITLAWTAPTKNVDGSAIAGTITYNLYSVASPNPVSLLTGISTLSTTRTSLNAGTPCYALTSVVAGQESALSQTVAVQVVEVPLPPTSVTCTITFPNNGGSATGDCVVK